MSWVEIGADIVDSALFVYFLNAFNGCIYRGKKAFITSILTFLLLLINILISDLYNFLSYYPIVIDFIITIIYSQKCLKGNKVEHVGSIILYHWGMLGTTLAVLWFISHIETEGFFLWITIGSSERMYLLIACKIILFLYVFIVIHLRQKFMFTYTRAAFFTFYFMPLVVLVLVFLLMELLFEFYYIDRRGKLLLGILVAVFILSIINIYLYLTAAKKEKIEKEKSYIMELFKTQQTIYNNELKHQKEIRNLEHDMKNRMLGLKHYFSRGETKKGIEKIDEILEGYNGSGNKLLLRDYIWETVIDTKIALAESKNISVMKKIHLGDYDGIDGIDLCIILGNLLDNAIEAEEKMDCKKIEVILSEEMGFVYICIRNNIDSRVTHIDVSRTSKHNSKNHGIGIKNVKEVTERYCGKVDFNVGGGMFVVTVLLKAAHK